MTAVLPRRPGVLVISTAEPSTRVWQQAVHLGVERVVVLPAGETWLASVFADAVERPSPIAGRVFAVFGGRGGAGASVFSTAIAVTALRRGDNALLVDCDPLGGGLDVLLGAENEAGPRWPELRMRGGRVAAAALRSALPGRSRGSARLSVVSCDRDGPGPTREALTAVVDAGRRAGETVVCDMPRGISEAAGAALDRTDLAVLVVPAELRACAAGRRVAAILRERGVPARAVVRGPTPGGLCAKDVAQVVGVPLLTAMRQEPGLNRALERGPLHPRPGGPLAVAAGAVLDALSPIGRSGVA